jgi:hypothetical protein
MALTNAERQKRWREKNRVIYNLRRRNARNKLVSGGSVVESASGSEAVTAKRQDGPPLTQFTTKKVGEFRMLVLPESTELVKTDNKPLIFRDDSGRVITERAWNLLQKKKADAKEGGYEIDEYSQ